MNDVTTTGTLPQQAGICPTQVASSRNGEQVDWVPFGWKLEENKNARPRGRGVNTFARRLMAEEWARVRRQPSPNLVASGRRGRPIQDGR